MPVQELDQRRCARLGCLLLKSVPAIEGRTFDVGCLLAPRGEDVVELSYGALGSPQSEERYFDSPMGVPCVMFEIDAGGCAVVLAYGVDRSGLEVAAEIFLDERLARHSRGFGSGR